MPAPGPSSADRRVRSRRADLRAGAAAGGGRGRRADRRRRPGGEARSRRAGASWERWSTARSIVPTSWSTPSGRLSRLAPPPDLGGDTGMAYVARTYRRRRDTAPGPLTRPFAWSGMFHGYDSYVFPHEHGHISAVIIRPTADADLGILRHRRSFDAACRAIPGPRRVDRPSVSPRRRAASWSAAAAQPLPAAARSTGSRGGRRRSRHHRPDRGPGGRHGKHADRRAPRAARRAAPTQPRSPTRSAHGATHGSGRGSRTTSPSTPRRSSDGRATTSTSVSRLTSAAIVAAAQADPRIEPHGGRLPRDDGAPGVAGSRRGLGPRRVRDGLAPTDGRRSDA